MDVVMQADARFWDKIARKYAKQPVSDPEAYERTLTRTRSYLRESDNVLEMGCGTGTSALKLADATGSYLATDLAAEMIAIATEKGTGTENVTFAVSDTRLDGVAEKSMDVLLSFNLFHLVLDLEQALGRVAEIVKPGGYFISKTPCLGTSWYLKPVIALMRLVGKAPYVAFLKSKDYDSAIEAAGFRIVEVAEHNKGTRGHFVVAQREG